MAKMKTHKGTQKRVKVTATGKVLRGQAGTSHLAPLRTPKRTRQLRKSAQVSPADYKRIKQQISNLK